MGTKSAWGAACVPLVLAAGAVFAILSPSETYDQLLPVLLLFAAVAASWYGGRRAGLTAAILCAVVLWVVAPAPGAVTVVASLALVLAALLTGGLRNARDRAEVALVERDARLALVSAQLPAILWSTDTELHVTTSMGTGGLANGAGNGAGGGNGNPNPNAIGSFLEFLNPADPGSPSHAAHLDALRGIASTFETHWRERAFQSHVEPLRNPEGETIGVVGVALEITERKKAERQMESAKVTAETATRAKDRFLAMLSHELRTPLTPALAAASVLQSDPRLPVEARFDLEMIRRNIELEVRLIDDLLDLTRISKGKIEFRFETEDVHQLLQGAIDICRDDVAAKGLGLRTEFHATRHYVGGDGARLRQVFWNLLKNSVKFTPSGGQVTVRTIDGPDGRLAVEFADTGVGIDAAALPQVFDAFEQGGTEVTRSFGGLGLGLAISKALIEAHRGKVEAHSAGRFQGATFRVELPTVAAPAGVAPPPPPPPPPPRQQQPAVEVQRAVANTELAHPARRLEILLVEDHHDTARVLKRLLDGSGHHVRTADTVRAALAAAAAEPFDVVVSDLGLPDGTGFELMRQLVRQYHAKGIALSGFGTDQDVQRSREAGFECHLTKPVDFRRLAEAIEQVAS